MRKSRVTLSSSTARFKMHCSDLRTSAFFQLSIVGWRRPGAFGCSSCATHWNSLFWSSCWSICLSWPPCAEESNTCVSRAGRVGSGCRGTDCCLGGWHQWWDGLWSCSARHRCRWRGSSCARHSWCLGVATVASPIYCACTSRAIACVHAVVPDRQLSHWSYLGKKVCPTASFVNGTEFVYPHACKRLQIIPLQVHQHHTKPNCSFKFSVWFIFVTRYSCLVSA